MATHSSSTAVSTWPCTTTRPAAPSSWSTPPRARSWPPAPPTATATSLSSPCATARWCTGGITSTLWPSSTRSAGPHADATGPVGDPASGLGRDRWFGKDASQHADVAADFQPAICCLGTGERAGEQGEDQLGFALKYEVGCRDRAEPSTNRTAGYLDDRGTVGCAELDRHRR